MSYIGLRRAVNEPRREKDQRQRGAEIANTGGGGWETRGRRGADPRRAKSLREIQVAG